MTRHVRLEGVENFRDFGDYAADGGRRLKKGQLYRSASHGKATDTDLAAIEALGIALVVDLRRPAERERDPSRRPTGFSGKVIANGQEESDDDDPWWNFIRGSDLTPASFRDYIHGYYREAPFAPRHMDLFTRYFRALAEADGPVLIHCAAGKDRTGLLAALTHRLAGVHADDIAEDFLLTNSPERLAARAPVMRQMITEATGGRAPSDEVLWLVMGVEAAYLAEAFASIEAEHGSVEAYLAGPLGVDAALREALEARLLV